MNSQPITDSHAHVFPSEEVGRFWQESVGLTVRLAGTSAQLVDSMDEAGVARAVILLFHRSAERFQILLGDGLSEPDARATIGDEIRSYNQWGCELAGTYPRLMPFVGANPQFLSGPEMTSHIAEMARIGAVGVKIIPNSMRLYGNDPSLMPLFSLCSELGLPILSQSGVGTGLRPGRDADPYGRPRYYADVLRRFPKLRLILAHLGSGFESDVVDLIAAFPNVWTDTSSRLVGLGRNATGGAMVVQLRKFGINRVLFGSNFPLADQVESVKTLRELPLTDGERRQIAFENFDALMSGVSNL